MFETLSKISAAIPTVVVRGLLLPAILGIAFIIWAQNNRITALEATQLVVAEQRRLETEAIKELTSEVRGQREQMQENARKQEAWALEIIRSRR